MGYYTTYYIDVNTKTKEEYDKKLDEIKLFIESLDGDQYWELKRLFEDGYLDAKWYHHSSDMAYLSSKFKDVEFELNGSGEQKNDYWYDTYLNGELVGCRECEIIDQFKDIDKKRSALLNRYNNILKEQPSLYYLNQTIVLRKLNDTAPTSRQLDLEIKLERWINKYGKN